MICLIFLLLLSLTISLRLGSFDNRRFFTVDNSSLRSIDLSLKAAPKTLAVETSNPCRIKVVGVGGGGGNAVNRMLESSLGVSGVDFWVINTDMQALTKSMVPNKLNIGTATSRWGRGFHIQLYAYQFIQSINQSIH
jgi:cell division GTPase FtsZ